MIRYIIIFIGIFVIGALLYLFVWVPAQHTERNDALPASVSNEERTSPETETEQMPLASTTDATNAGAKTMEEPQISARTEVVGTTGHPASGYARVFEDDGQRYLRYEEFKTINGPDLFVYLATDEEASDVVNLGKLKATQGNINYKIPDGVDLATYSHALVWCRTFNVLFNSADLTSVVD